MVIHEVVPMPEAIVKFYNQPPERAIRAHDTRKIQEEVRAEVEIL